MAGVPCAPLLVTARLDGDDRPGGTRGVCRRAGSVSALDPDPSVGAIQAGPDSSRA